MSKTPLRGALLAVFGAALIGCGPAHPQVDPSAWRTPDPENILVIDTNKGRIIAELAPSIAPLQVERIKVLTRRNFYDGLKFFRVINDFMAQTGDPRNSGQGGSDLPDLKAEFEFRRTAQTPFAHVATSQDSAEGITGVVNTVPVFTQPDGQMLITADHASRSMAIFCPGVLGAARATNPDSANSQFYLMRENTPNAMNLNGKYTAFGRVISGLDIVRSIKVGEPVAEPMDAMTKVRILADIPEAERPKVQVMDINSKAFADHVEAWLKSAGADSDICDLDIPVQVQ